MRRHSLPGSAPGTLVSQPGAAATTIEVIAFGPEGVEERTDVPAHEAGASRGSGPVVWVNIEGLEDIEAIQALGETFDLHPLALEDSVNTHQRPKVEDYEGHLFAVVRMPATAALVATEQMSLFLGNDYLITFQERPGDWFDRVRGRIRDPHSRVRAQGPDYLAYALIDAAIDAYFPILEELGERVENLEQEVMLAPQRDHPQRIHAVRRDLLTVRRAVWPMRELLNGMLRDDHSFIGDSTLVFLRDCYDHTIQLMDMIDTQRDMVASLTDIHLSSINARMNEVMKVLTVIATIFIPLGFVASLYGMNFETSVSPWNMPELAWRFGYPFALGLMFAIAIGLLIWFRRKGWIGARRDQATRIRKHHRLR